MFSDRSLLGASGAQTGEILIPPGASTIPLSLHTPPVQGSQAFAVYTLRLYRGEIGGAPVWEVELQGPLTAKPQIGIEVPITAFEHHGVYSLQLLRYRTREKNLQHAISTRYRMRVSRQ